MSEQSKENKQMNKLKHKIFSLNGEKMKNYSDDDKKDKDK